MFACILSILDSPPLGFGQKSQKVNPTRKCSTNTCALLLCCFSSCIIVRVHDMYNYTLTATTTIAFNFIKKIDS